MRILIIQDQLRIGGTERQSLLTAADLKQQGHEPTLLLFRPGGRLFKETAQQEFPVRVLQRFNSGVSLWAPGLKRTVRSIQPQVILCMGRTANCYAGHLQASFPSIPVVATVRTGKRLLPMHASSLAKAACIVVNCNWWKRELIKRNLAQDKIHVIHNASLLPAGKTDPAPEGLALRKQMGSGDNTCIFLNVASFRPGKRHMDLLLAFQRFNRIYPQTDWQLWLAGSGKTLIKCRNWCTSQGLGSHVHFLGYQADPTPFYAAADVAVSLSTEDSLPNFLVEAQMQGLPVIARDYRGVQETFVPGKSGILVKTNSPGTLAPLFQQLATHEDLRQAYSEAARKFARSRFDRDQQSKKLYKLLGRLNAGGI